MLCAGPIAGKCICQMKKIGENSSGILRKLNDDFTLSKNITLRQIIND